MISLKIGTGGFGLCTGTLIDASWVLTARHCMEAAQGTETQARAGEQVRDVEMWAFAPEGVIALADSLPIVGAQGTFHGLSGADPAVRRGEEPVVPATVAEHHDFGSYGLNQSFTLTLSPPDGFQGGDSGAPFITDGKVAGVATAPEVPGYPQYSAQTAGPLGVVSVLVLAVVAVMKRRKQRVTAD